MTRVRLLRPIAQHRAGATVEYRDSEAAMLVRHGVAERVHLPARVEQPALVDTTPGEAGSRQHEAKPTVMGQPEDGAAQVVLPSLADLKAQASELGVPTYGTKAQIADRIMRADGRNVTEIDGR